MRCFSAKDRYLCLMLNIVKHIQQLLPLHDCVIVPDWGGFVVQEIATAFDPQTHSFSPAHKEVVFNESLQYNDGLLIESYRKTDQIDYATARQQLLTDVALLKRTLQTEGSITLGTIGSFTLGDEGQLIFSAGDTAWLNASFYGLASFTFEPLAATAPTLAEQPIADKERQVYYIPISRTFVRIMAAAIVALALFLGTSLPVEEIDRTAYTAGFIPSEMVAATHWKTEKPQQTTADNETTDAAITEKEIPASTTTVAAPAEKQEITSASAPHPTEKQETSTAKMAEKASQPAAKISNGKKYYAIVGSFPTRTQADKFVSTADKSLCPTMDILQQNEKFRVYAACFDTREKAESYIEKLRGHSSSYKDAWLFITR